MGTKRKQYLINKSFQTEFILKFCGLVVLGCVVFGIILYVFSSRTLTTSFENSRLVVKSTADYLLPGLLFGCLIVGLFMAMASSIVVVFMTHRIAGPVYRFEKHIKQIGSGELSSDLKIRRKDQFRELVDVLNKMTYDLRLGLLRVIGVTEKLDGLIEKLSDTANSKMLLKDDIKKIVSELRRDKQSLKKAISYFKIKR